MRKQTIILFGSVLFSFRGKNHDKCEKCMFFYQLNWFSGHKFFFLVLLHIRTNLIFLHNIYSQQQNICEREFNNNKKKTKN